MSFLSPEGLGDILDTEVSPCSDGRITPSVRDTVRRAFFEVLTTDMPPQDVLYVKAMARQCINFLNDKYNS